MSDAALKASVMKLPENACRHHHRHHQLVVGLRGAAEIDVEGLGAYLDSSHACIVPTDASHDFYGDHQNNVLVINLDTANPSISNPRHPDYDRLASLFERPRLLVMDDEMQTLIQLCSRQMQGEAQDDAVERHFAAGIMHCLGRRIERPESRRIKVHALDMRALDRFIDRHLQDKLTITDLACEVCLSPSHFHELFRDATGLSPHQYLIRKRLAKARELLLETQLSLADISYQVGFSSQSALTGAFRKYYQVTPAALRTWVV